ncbi:hypothetical protein [Prochlorococcus marinus]
MSLEWPDSLPLTDLRKFVLDKLKDVGEPLRWAITSITSSKKVKSSRLLKVEAVLIIH